MAVKGPGREEHRNEKSLQGLRRGVLTFRIAGDSFLTGTPR